MTQASYAPTIIFAQRIQRKTDMMIDDAVNGRSSLLCERPNKN